VNFFVFGVWFDEVSWELPVVINSKTAYNFVFVWANWVRMNASFVYLSHDMIVFGIIFMLPLKFLVLNEKMSGKLRKLGSNSFETQQVT
jgi:hypothetical protein